MAKDKVRVYEVKYGDLVKQIKKTVTALKKIENKVGAEQKDDIAEQIKTLSYLEGVCAKGMPEVAAMAPKPKMTGCKMAKMTRLYTSV